MIKASKKYLNSFNAEYLKNNLPNVNVQAVKFKWNLKLFMWTIFWTKL